MMTTIARLVDLGNTEKEAEKLYAFYASNNKLQELEDYIFTKEFFRGDKNGKSNREKPI